MTHVFEQLLTMAITTLPVMAVVLAARWLLRGTPKRYTYLLWLVVGFRLLCPVAPESPVGLVQAEKTALQISEIADTYADTYIEPTLTYRDNGGFTPDYDVLLNRGYTPNAAGEIITNEAGTREALQVEDLFAGAAAVWILGMAAMALYLVFSTLRLKRQVAMAVRREGNVWECDGIPTPFVLGLFRPRIYIPFRMTEAERAYILAHERYHIRRGDHWAKLLGLVILTIYWWNPAVWLCWVLFCRDMEMRCDEAVLARLGDGVKQDYSRSLISFALDRRAPMALAFGEHDAAKRVKHVLKWKKAAPAVVFLAAAAVILVVLVCGTNAQSAKYNQVTLRTSPTGGMEFDVEATEDIHSWCLYRDIYHNGTLISSTETVLDGFADENNGVSTRDFTGRLYVEAEHDSEGGFTNTLTWTATLFGKAGFTETLPEAHYTGAVHIIGEGKAESTYRLEPDEDILLYTVLLSTEPEGKTTTFSANRPLTQVNNTVMQYRLLLSSGAMDDLPVPQLDLAQALFDLRLFSLREPNDALPLTEKLGVDGFCGIGGYSLARETTNNGSTLLIAFDTPPTNEEALQKEMWGVSCLLTALIGDIDGVNYSYPFVSAEGQQHLITVYGDQGGDSYAETLGYESLHDLGRSAAGIRALMQYLGMDTGSEDAASSLAKALYAARNEPEKLLSLLDPAGELGHCEFMHSASNYLTMMFHDASMDPMLRDTMIWKYSMVMLALLDQYVATSWNWMDDGVQAYEGNSGLWNTAEWLTEHGLEENVRAYGVSPVMVQVLLEALNLRSSDAARSLFVAMQPLDDLGLMQYLLGADLWGGRIIQPATVGWPGNFGPSVSFYQTPEDSDALDVAMARRAALLMKLRPEVGYVLWSYPDENGQQLHRDLHSSEAAILTSLSSHTQNYLPVETAEDLDLYIRFLNLDEKLFLYYAKNDLQREFANVLLSREDVGSLLDDRAPSDFYFDLDTWEDESVEELDGYVYYRQIPRAEFRQFVERFVVIPEELRNIELEGAEYDLANITVSGTWTRAEIERLNAAMNGTLPETGSGATGTPESSESVVTPPSETTPDAPPSTGYQLYPVFRAGSVEAANEEIKQLVNGWSEDPGTSSAGGYTFRHLQDGDYYRSYCITEDGTVYQLPYPTAPVSHVQHNLDVNTMTYSHIVTVREGATAENDTALPAAAGTYIYSISLPDFLCTESFVPAKNLTGQTEFAGIMGYTGYFTTETGAGPGHTVRTYYTIQGGGPMKIAETFGFDEPQDYVVDLDGDGVTELVANVTYGGDGARRVYVYQRRGNDVYLGTLSPTGLPNFNNWGANAYWSEYDPQEQVFRIHYAQKNSDEYGLLETKDLSRLTFSKFTP